MRPADVVELLRGRDINPSAQRVAVAEYILFTDEHPSAERVWARVRRRFPMISRATVYNTLNLFAEKGLVRELHLSPHSIVFDANIDAHHHLIDEDTGRIYDIPWEKAEMTTLPNVDGFEIRDYQVVMRGRRAPGRERKAPTHRGDNREQEEKSQKEREEKDRRA